MPGSRILGHDEWVRSKLGILLVSFRRRSIRRNMALEILVYHGFASRNRLLQRGEITQLVSPVVGREVVVVIHIDRIGIPQSRHIASSWPSYALLCQPA